MRLARHGMIVGEFLLHCSPFAGSVGCLPWLKSPKHQRGFLPVPGSYSGGNAGVAVASDRRSQQPQNHQSVITISAVMRIVPGAYINRFRVDRLCPHPVRLGSRARHVSWAANEVVDGRPAPAMTWYARPASLTQLDYSPRAGHDGDRCYPMRSKRAPCSRNQGTAVAVCGVSRSTSAQKRLPWFM
jgi:hypothetical protein